MDTTKLEDRMKLHKPGQLTWPEPKLKAWCGRCRFYDKSDTANTESGRCDLVFAHQRTKGKAFKGDTAVACPKYKQGNHPNNERQE